ncbi:hypothetical protein BV499_04350 [Helicobacter pylori]|nr:hypothetical protein BV499_04350 [Helicobacter pylori]
MVKERPEEARNSPKGNFFISPLGELWRVLALFYILLFVLSCFIKISKSVYNNHSLSIVLKGQRE